MTTVDGDFMCSSEYSYAPDWTVKLLVYRTAVISGIFKHNHDVVQWVNPKDLFNYFCEQLSSPILEKLAKENSCYKPLSRDNKGKCSRLFIMKSKKEEMNDSE